MKAILHAGLQHALETLLSEAGLSLNDLPETARDPQLTRTKDAAHGDFATNLAMMLAKPLKKNPRDIAEQLKAAFPAHPAVTKIDIAGPGFINFTLSANATQSVIKTILEQKNCYGRSGLGKGQSVYLEFVSANPTGPLHVGHGRGAAFGASLGNLLEAAGYTVHREYYVNDAGRQMAILTLSIFLRYLALCGETITFPTNGYQGDYITDIAKDLHQAHNTQFVVPAIELFAELPSTEDEDKHIDALIDNAKNYLGKDFQFILSFGVDAILSDIRDDLSEFGVNFQEWYSERALLDSGAIERAIQTLKESGNVYEDNGALWFASTQYGDDKDRVIVRENGLHTYFLSDVAYHLEKFSGPYDKIIDIFGADHHGYIARLVAAIKAGGHDAEKFKTLLVQFAILYRGKEKVSMSTRSGEFVTLRELREEVGNDAARFYYVMRKNEQHMDFDLELAKSKSNENPVYYVQYAHARICSVFTQCGAQNVSFDEAVGCAHLNLLTTPQETALIETLSRYPELVHQAAEQYAPHRIAHYLQDLAADFHTYYNAEKFIVTDGNVCQARLALITATRHVLVNALSLLGVHAPEKM